MRWIAIGAASILMGCQVPNTHAPRLHSKVGGNTAPVRPDVSLAPSPFKPIPTTNDIACELPSNDWSGDLQLWVDGPVYAGVEHAHATLSVWRTKAQAHVVVGVGGLELAGVVTAPTVFLERPFALGGFIVPHGFTPLDAKGPHSRGKINVALDISDLFSDPPSVHQELPCSAVSAGPKEYEGAGLTKISTDETVVLRADTDVRLEAGGAVVAKLRRAARARLGKSSSAGTTEAVIQAFGYDALGWVPRDAVDRHSRLALPPTVRMGATQIGALRERVCPSDVPVFVEVGSEAAEVGRLTARSPFYEEVDWPAPRHHGMVVVGVPGNWLRLALGASLLMRADNIAGCSWMTPEPDR